MKPDVPAKQLIYNWIQRISISSLIHQSTTQATMMSIKSNRCGNVAGASRYGLVRHSSSGV